MSLQTLMGRLRTRSMAAALIVTAAVLIPAGLMAWGPSRKTYTMASPAASVVFNSITDNPEYGDERQFVNIKDAADTTEGNWHNSVNVQSGHTYWVRMYVHNDASENLGLVATNSRVQAAISGATGTTVPITGYVSADNATPTKVWADVELKSDKQFNVAYVPGSTMIYNAITGTAGRAVSDDILKSGGTQIGYTANNGKIPGCMQYASYVYFKVKPQFAPTTTFTVNKQVRKASTTTWLESVTANAGDQLEYLIGYKNTGEVEQKNVVVKDTLPAGISYVAGTTYLYNTTNPNGLKVSDNVVSSQGINIGNYTAGSNAYVKFTAKVAANDNLPACGTNTLTNLGKVVTDYGTNQDTANTTVNKTCVVPEKIQVCRLSDKTIITIDKSAFDSTKHSKTLTDCKDIELCRLNDKTIVTLTVTQYNADKDSYSTTLSDCASTPPTTPPTPPELPHTGAGDVIVSILGAGSLTAVIGAYLASRRAHIGA